MKSAICLSETPIQSHTQSQTQPKSIYDQKAIDRCVAKAWFDLVAQPVDSCQGDDWLYLCGDIDDGEIYQDWFLWQDLEVSQDWEAYDPLTNFRLVAPDRASLILQIDQIAQKNVSMVDLP
jgi:hypothetical protein